MIYLEFVRQTANSHDDADGYRKAHIGVDTRVDARVETSGHLNGSAVSDAARRMPKNARPGSRFNPPLSDYREKRLRVMFTQYVCVLIAAMSSASALSAVSRVFSG
jgi:hypothetical protein